ncbi:hypothetical protein RhiJN_11661 [Ceratobasidium sp. AG-Ba]|nr:hypothetical protein RhiJN_11661 [Ceratobasidium sp. AG-Ba]QRW05957.1 hypothetical protein RhiLY_04956 [Ceratobasidium sp. AG-Ba]QRW12313.1 hypothetical protein RhiLY_11312 [Ceratobasidium sp. AG-Ba]
MSNPNESTPDAPVAWFTDPQGQNAPNPGAEVYINQGAQPQSGQGPTGQAWTPQNQADDGQAASQSTTDNLFPTSKPLQPKF